MSQEERDLHTEDEPPVPLGEAVAPAFAARLERLYLLSLPALAKLVRRHSGARGEAARPLIHDAYVKALEHAGALEGASDGELVSWLQTTVRGECANWRQREERRGEAPSDPRVLDELVATADTPPQEQAERREVLARAFEALATLTPAQSEAFFRVDVQRAPYGQVGERMGLSERQLRRRLEEARQALAAFQLRRAGREECRRLWPLLCAEPIGVEPRARRAARHHLAGCAACRADLRHLQFVRAGLGALVPVPVVAAAGEPALSHAARVGAWATEHLLGLGQTLAERMRENPVGVLRRTAKTAGALALVLFLAGVGTMAWFGARVLGWPVAVFGGSGQPPRAAPAAERDSVSARRLPATVVAPDRRRARASHRVIVSHRERVTRVGAPRAPAARHAAAPVRVRHRSPAPAASSSFASLPASARSISAPAPRSVASAPDNSSAAEAAPGGSSSPTARAPSVAPLGSAEARRRAAAAAGP